MVAPSRPRPPAAQTSAVDLPTRKPAAVPTKKPGPAPCPLFSPSVWGRFFGQTIHNNYQAFADPNANVSVFANVDYEFAVGAAQNEKQSGVRGAFGARYTW